MKQPIEEQKEALYFETGFDVQREVETLKSVISIAEDLHNGHMPALKETREAVKKSVKELCDFFCNFVDCL